MLQVKTLYINKLYLFW